MTPAGYVALAAVALVFGYLVPALVRRREAFGEARVEDRFSAGLRVVRRDAPARAVREQRAVSAAPLLASRPTTTSIHRERGMTRPTGMATRVAATQARRDAAYRAAVAARRAEQAAAARRRLILTIALAVTAAVSWTAVVLSSFSLWLALAPTVALVAVVWLGVRTAGAERAERAAEPAYEPRRVAPAGPTYSASQLRAHLASGEAEPSSLTWKTDDDVPPPAEALTEELDAVADGWTPVPVPVPTYTLKPAAPPRDTVAWTPEESAGEAEVTAAESASEAPAEVAAATSGEESGIDLSAVLARRRESA